MKLRATPFEIGAAIAVTVTSAALVVMGTRTDTVEVERVKTVVVEKERAPEQRPRIDVVFVLDTTGSMTSLIDGAKRKIWSVANRLASGTPQPEIRIGLVGYRDIGDAYVTQSFPLTTDIDEAYQHLLGFNADGGGDTREHVNKALDDAINGMQWSQQDNTLKLVFLVGDAPAHDDYSDVPTSQALAAQARQQGILINTIRCGYDRETEESWQRIAQLAGGQYTSIAQSGGMVDLSTPFDDELRKLNVDLASTSMAFGSYEQKQAAHRKVSTRKAMSAPAAAAAASYSAKSGRMNAEDLIGALDQGHVDLDSLSDEELPTELQGVAKDARHGVVAAKKAKRKAIERKILEISEKRDKYVQGAAEGADDGFDGQVVNMLRDQAGSIGVAY